jgi:peptidoglycan/LPS O-acetylase OafA/YrhL
MGALTGLRFWPSLYVVLFHFGGIVMADAPEPLQRLRLGAPVSVDLFYLLSGFVLTYNYLADRPLRSRSFWGARFARIYPSYLLSLILVGPFILYLHFTSLPPGAALGLTAVELVAVGLLVQAWLPPLALAWNYPAWSLSVEIFFYMVFPALGRRIKALGARTLAILLPVGWALALVGPILVWFGTTLADADTGRTLAEIGLYNPLIRLPESLLGVVLGRLFLLRGPLPRSGWWAWAALAGLALVLMTGPGEAEGAWTPYYRAAIVPLFGLLIYALAEGSGWVARAFDHPIMRRLGEASYAIYLLQVPVALIVQAVMQPRPVFASEKDFIQPFATWPNFLIYFAILTALCLATERLIEIPLRDRIRARIAARAPAAAPPPGLQI